jgi:chromosome segregation ATPase
VSGDALALLVLVGTSILIGAIWLAGRRRDRAALRQTVLARVKERAERIVTAEEALTRAVEELETAKRFLGEVSTIGLWTKSDDSSDNRRKRQGLRETDWAVSGAQRALAAVAAPLRNERLEALETDLRALVARLEPLPDTVSDTMGDSPSLDATILSLSEEVTRLRERASLLAAEPRDPIR